MVKMRLLDRIEEAKRKAEALANHTREQDKEFVWEYGFQSVLQSIVNDDLMHNNPDNLFKEYKEYFKTKRLPTKIITTNELFYRGRIGNEIIYGAEDDHSRCFLYYHIIRMKLNHHHQYTQLAEGLIEKEYPIYI